MNKRSFISFASLLVFWIVISGTTNLQHIIVGIVLSLFTMWFWKNLSPRLPSVLSFREILLFIRTILILAGYVIKSNIDVAKILLFSDLKESSMFLELEPGIKSNWGKVFLATCITITPGTVTIDINPETGVFTVHALTRETGLELYYWSIITEISDLERLIRRREAHVVDTDRIHGTNTFNTAKSDNRTNGN